MFSSTREDMPMIPSFRKKAIGVEKPTEKSNYEVLFNLTPKLYSKSREIEKIVVELLKLPENKIKTMQSSKDNKITDIWEYFSICLQKKTDMSFQDYLAGLEYQKEYIVPLQNDVISKVSTFYSTYSNESNVTSELMLMNQFATKLYDFSKEYADDMSYEVFGKV